MAIIKFIQICEESFRFINMSKHTTRYLTVNIRLVFLKILDDIRNERLLGSLELIVKYEFTLCRYLMAGGELLDFEMQEKMSRAPKKKKKRTN